LKNKKKNIKFWFITLGCCFIVLAAGLLLLKRLEGEKPAIVLELASGYLNLSQTISVTVSDANSGLRRIWIGLVKDKKEVVLLDKNFPATGFAGGGKIHKATFKIKIEPKEIGITDGKAILRMVVRDFSWRKWWRGNRTYIEKDVTIDTRPPQIDLLTRVHNLSQGGAGLVIFRVSEPCIAQGVYAGENFFPGHAGYFKDPNIIIAFFALSYKQGPDTEVFVKATDYAGNGGRTGFPHYFKRKAFKKDVINISDRFLNWKMPEFDVKTPLDSKAPMVDKFLKVNRDIRKANYRQLTRLLVKTDNVIYWDGPFGRLPKSARRAGFADHRKYTYKGPVIDEQVHLGIDLASLAHSPVPASNKGKVVFAGPMGIYGKTVVLDHGFGLFSMYAHLSAVNVSEGQIVAKGEIIGRTGSTGMAGGDHLHFAMLVHDTFVNPVEWWDAAWIKNNITSKIEGLSELQSKGSIRK
jgi:murein DD-endopeptidase MepM/ murein hydrolase activator NlpD